MKIIFENNKKVSEYPNGIFETLLVKDGFPIFLEYHFKRFITGLKEYLNISFSESDLINLRKELLDHLEKGDYGCRFVYCENTIYISYRQLENKDVSSLTISRNIRQSSDEKYRYKTTDYKERLEDLTYVRSLGYLDNLYLNEEGYITSTSIANIYFIKNNEIYTPKLELGVLNGTVRQIIGEKYKLNEIKLKTEDIKEFDCAFITNSLVGLKKIESIDGIIFNGNCILWEDLCKYYKERILKEKEGQFIG